MHAQKAVTGRLEAIAPHLGVDDDVIRSAASRGPGPLLDVLARQVKRLDREADVWLLLAGFLGQYPLADDVRMVRRRLRMVDEAVAFRVVLAAGSALPLGFADPEIELEVVVGRVVVDVDFCAKYRHNTGVQRVVRETVSRWDRDHEVRLVAFTATGSSMRTLSDEERRRVVEWDGSVSAAAVDIAKDPQGVRLVVPIDCTIIIPEVPQTAQCAELAALAEFSGNRVGLIAHDMIPVVSPNTVVGAETERFVKYLTLVKHSTRLAGVSKSATQEFAGFVSALPAQGLTGPVTVAVELPTDSPSVPIARVSAPAGPPVVLCVGSQEPRKNHDAVLLAADLLWQEGLDFGLTFVGAGTSVNMSRFDSRVAALRHGGHRIRVLRGLDDQTLMDEYRRARFSIFPSLHEGYGLPVAESLALGTPVITTSYGSTAEIAAAGGCLLVDPRDDETIITQMRRLLTDDDLLADLQQEIARRPPSSWDDYADRLWRGLVVPMGGVSDRG